jgi:hypothetical protein
MSDFLAGLIFGAFIGTFIVFIGVVVKDENPYHQIKNWWRERKRLPFPNVRIAFNGYDYIIERQNYKNGSWNSVWFPNKNGPSGGLFIGASVTTFKTKDEAIDEYKQLLENLKKEYAEYEPVTLGFDSPLWRTLNGEE